MSTVALPPELLAAAQKLANALRRADPVDTYNQAQAAFDADPQANILLDLITLAQTNLRRSQSNGTVTQADVDKLRSLQGQAQSNAVIMEYLEAQQAANAYLSSVNLAISQLLGIDFAQMARPGCC